jgi:2-polyprenyl-3-methyl-5-hydroxy-6-metoxy-1,4-benzoquinol methylase
VYQALANNGPARFWDRIAIRYAEKPIADIPVYEKKLALSQRHLSPDARLLEFGCGTGGTALAHARHVGHVLATDYSAKMIELAKAQQCSQGIRNVEFRQATLGDINTDEGPFDAVLGLNVLHLIPDYRTHIEQAHALLARDGILVTSTVCLGLTNPLRLVLALPAALGLIPRVVYFEAGQLEQGINAAGFQTIERLEIGRDLFLISRKQ